MGVEKRYPWIAGLCLVGAGIFEILTGLLYFYWMSLLGISEARPNYIAYCAWWNLILSPLVFLAAILSFKKRHYRLARTGSIAAIVSIGGGVSLVLGTIALVLLLKGEDEFIE